MRSCTAAMVLKMILTVGFAGGMGMRGRAQNVISIDATMPVAMPQPVQAKLGTSRNPQGHVIGVNSQYLTMDGRPWIPVMGEFHYTRYPEAEWEQEILKMKAAGVGVVSTYVIWNHHEQAEGIWDWTGQRDLRRFVKLCGEHGMYVYPRIGPWAHAEVRHGGFPDWVLKNGPVRENNPVYLKEVQSFYAQIANQLKGELWKDGGPVIGIQIENEYREAPVGSGKGSEHIRKLKEMAVADGMDVPLYTVTGWDGAAVPLDAVLPVFGGYPDAPWDGSNKALYGNEIYAFRFKNRVAGSMGAVGGRGQNPASSYRGTPFLTAEVGDGGQDTYFRRPVFDADDIAAIVPVMLGSGVNLLGYYMFHGGVNPDAEASGTPITLEESQRAGDATDVPEKSYDFQAPLGKFGQERESLRNLKLVHYFLNDFGAQLAPMTTREPAQIPSGPKDTSIARVAARTDGESGFVFVSNYVRGLTMPERKGFQVQLRLPDGVLKVPEETINLPAGAYGIWPVNLPLRVAANGELTLRYSTAQLFKRINLNGQMYYFFFALPGVQAEFVLAAGAKVSSVTGPVETRHSDEGIELRVVGAGAAEITLDGGVHLVALPETEAEQVWRGDDSAMLLKTKADAFSDGARWTLQEDNFRIEFGLFGAVKPRIPSSVAADTNGDCREIGRNGLFTEYGTTLPKVVLKPAVTKVQDAAPRRPWTLGPKLPWRENALPLKPQVSEFAGAAMWRIEVPRAPGTQLSDVWLTIDYQGDEARLMDGKRLVDDNFWNGLPWRIGLKETLPGWRSSGSTLELQVLSLPKLYPIYLEKAGALHFNASGVADSLIDVRLVPQYREVLDVTERQ